MEKAPPIATSLDASFSPNLVQSRGISAKRGALSPKFAAIILCCVGVFLAIFLVGLDQVKPAGRQVIVISCCTDGPSYFSMAHALLFHHNFNVTEEFRRFGVPTDRGVAKIIKATGLPDSQYAIGYSLLEIPFLALGTGVDALTHHPTDGYGRYAITFYFLGNVFFVTVGMVCLFWFLYGLGELLPIAERERVGIALAVPLILLPTTTLGYYTYSAMAHAAGFMSLSMFLFAWWITRNSPIAWRWALLGFLGAIATLCRWQNGLYLSAPILSDFLVFASTRKWPGNISLPRWLSLRALYSVVFFSSLVPQMLEWKALYNRYLTIPEGPYFMQFPPRFIHKVLFSSQHGWFIWTPITCICVIGLIWGCFRFARYLLPWALIMCAEVAVNGSLPTDWSSDEAFGIRSLTCSLPVVAVGLALLFWCASKKMKPFVWAAVSLCVVFSVLFAIQYRLDLLPRDDRLVASEMFRDKIFLRQAYARNRAAKRVTALVKSGEPQQAQEAANSAIQRYGEDRFLLDSLAKADVAVGDSAVAQQDQARLQQFLNQRLF